VREVRGWDRAATQGCGSWDEIGPDNPPVVEADWTSGVRLGYDRLGNYYITGYTSGQWSPGPRDQRIRETMRADGLRVMQRGEQEPGAAGVSDARAFRRLGTGFRVTLEKSSEAKEIRSGPLASAIEGGRFFIVEAPPSSRPDAGAAQSWTQRLLQNLQRTDFKSGHDDDADALTVGFNWLSIFELRETEGGEGGAAPDDTDGGTEGSQIVTDLT
jgi:predicted phage terminase large subunit-like protein